MSHVRNNVRQWQYGDKYDITSVLQKPAVQQRGQWWTWHTLQVLLPIRVRSTSWGRQTGREQRGALPCHEQPADVSLRPFHVPSPSRGGKLRRPPLKGQPWGTVLGQYFLSILICCPTGPSPTMINVHWGEFTPPIQRAVSTRGISFRFGKLQADTVLGVCLTFFFFLFFQMFYFFPFRICALVVLGNLWPLCVFN